MSLDKIANILGQETIKEIYKDGGSEPLKEASKIAVDIIKAFRLFTAPLQLAAAYQDRLAKFTDKVREGVPESHQIEAPSSLAGPILEKLKYLEDENYLIDLYMNLLRRAIDKERVNEAHPAFRTIIDQLAPDEAMLLYLIGQEPILYDYTMDLIYLDDKPSNFKNPVVQFNSLKANSLTFESNFSMYINHLESLNLVNWGLISEDPIYEDTKQSGTIRKTKITLKDFGSLFVKACIPEKGFMIFNPD